MARSDMVFCDYSRWTELTADDCTKATIHNLTGGTIWVQVTTGSAPTLNPPAASIPYESYTGERGVTLADWFPGVSSGDRIFCWPDKPGNVFISHD